MHFRRELTFLFVFEICLSCISCGRTHATKHVDRATLLEAVRQYGHDKQPNQPAPANQSIEKAPVSSSNPDAEREYRNENASYLVERNFSQLEKTANEARAGKARFAGGVWKLYGFYDGVSQPAVGDQATDADWTTQIDFLKEWITAKPESVTARLALAEAYIKYADKARGGGYANTVSDDAWKLDAERTDLAAATLVEAARLKEKCPYWYEVMQQVALGQGWEKAQARELFDQAAAFEPGYYHFYREYAFYLLPKWYGGPGDAEAFADESYNRVAGPEGKFIYFEIASILTCQCDSTDTDMDHLSWPKIKEGYAALGQLYGSSSLKMNRFAHMAFEAGDRQAAEEAFATIGNDWDHSVWHSSQKFETAKVWAINQ
ncbi:MAG: hypothetical protein ACRD5M_08885 [Candidatus Acidiferrales bacterium]